MDSFLSLFGVYQCAAISWLSDTSNTALNWRLPAPILSLKLALLLFLVGLRLTLPLLVSLPLPLPSTCLLPALAPAPLPLLTGLAPFGSRP